MLVCSLGYGKLLLFYEPEMNWLRYLILGGYYGKPNECWCDIQQT